MAGAPAAERSGPVADADQAGRVQPLSRVEQRLRPEAAVPAVARVVGGGVHYVEARFDHGGDDLGTRVQDERPRAGRGWAQVRDARLQRGHGEVGRLDEVARAIEHRPVVGQRLQSFAYAASRHQIAGGQQAGRICRGGLIGPAEEIDDGLGPDGRVHAQPALCADRGGGCGVAVGVVAFHHQRPDAQAQRRHRHKRDGAGLIGHPFDDRRGRPEVRLRRRPREQRRCDGVGVRFGEVERERLGRCAEVRPVRHLAADD